MDERYRFYLSTHEQGHTVETMQQWDNIGESLGEQTATH